MKYQKALETTIGMLLESYQFYACLVQQCSINWTFQLPTAAVRCLPNGHLEMVINPEFFMQLTPKERVGLVLHEMLHLVNDHLSRSFGLDSQIANIAMDTAINQFIPLDYLPPGALLPDNVVYLENRVRKQQGEPEIKMENMKQFEVYYNILKTEFDRMSIKELQNPHQFSGQLDSDKQPQKPMTEEEKKKQEDEMKNMLKELLEEERELERTKREMMENQGQLSDDEKKELDSILLAQKDLIKTQQQIQTLIQATGMKEISALNTVVTETLASSRESIEKNIKL